MNLSQVIKLLKEHQNEKGMEHWARLGPKTGKLKSYGIGLTVLRKLAKKVGKDHALAMELWKSDVYDARILALLIDDPRAITREQAEAQVEKLEQGYLAHVFSSCDATLAKTTFVVELASDWIHSKDPIRRRCGYGLLYEISKSKKKSAPDDTFFLEHIEHIHKSFTQADNLTLLSMGGALLGIGKRNRRLHVSALKVAKKIGPIEVRSGVTQCEPFDVVKNLTSGYVTQKLGL